MAALAPSPAEQTTTTREHAVLLLLLTANSLLQIYLSWGDLVPVAAAGVTYVAVLLLFGRIFGCCWGPRTDGGRRRLEGGIGFIFLLLGVFQVCWLLAQTTASSTSSVDMFLAAAGAIVLGVGGCCSYMLHRLTLSKQQLGSNLLAA